jgi:Tfp pilus assembly protein PilZ
MRERTAVRVIPRSAVTVAIENQGYPMAYGVVANISDAGACVWTNGAFAVGESLVLRLSFPHESQPLQAAGRVVWEDPQRDERGAMRLGVQWSHAIGPAHARLKQMINGAT